MPVTDPGNYTPEMIENITGRLEELKGELLALAGAMKSHQVNKLEINFHKAQQTALVKIDRFTKSGFSSLEDYRRERGDYGKPAEGSLPAATGKVPGNGRTKVKDQERSSKGKRK